MGGGGGGGGRTMVCGSTSSLDVTGRLLVMMFVMFVVDVVLVQRGEERRPMRDDGFDA
jgi:hypothetical protein